MENLGSKFTVRLKNRTEVLRNVTEVHFNYPHSVEKSIAFESDIHQTGMTFTVKDVEEFFSELETIKAPNF